MAIVFEFDRRRARMTALVAVTEEAQRALGDKPEVCMTRFPFNVGRALQLNDASVTDPQPVKQISREHFVVDRIDDGYWLIDRSSACGTIVAGTHIGGERRGGRIQLRDGDLITIGNGKSPYTYRFQIVAAAE